MTKMAAVWIASALLLALCSGLTQAGKHCHITHQGHEITKYCDYGCCIDRCCRHVHEKFMDNWVIGVIVIVCVFVGVAIMASICHCLKHGLSGNWNHPAPQPPRPCVAVINQGALLWWVVLIIVLIIGTCIFGAICCCVLRSRSRRLANATAMHTVEGVLVYNTTGQATMGPWPQPGAYSTGGSYTQAYGIANPGYNPADPAQDTLPPRYSEVTAASLPVDAQKH
ncbi:hypothetical protein BaRGS_00023669 [Batillaria attramentaria]|uniref:Uncharacterized protein n=1 Tax=Batillaria attramentaria TaxID=370345 RepID=A0ABD0KDF3_9CAEN